MAKLFFDECDMVTKEPSPPKMPRTAIIPVVRNVETSWLNAGPVSAGVLSINPYHIFFGVKSWDSKFTYRDAEEFVIAVPSRDQIDHMWVMANSVPAGINEIELANWTELSSRYIATPGIEECPLNLECRRTHFIQLKQPMRAVVIGEVVGVSMDSNLLDLSRAEVVRQFPMHEATLNPYTGLYGPSVLNGELIPSTEPPHPVNKGSYGTEQKVFIPKEDMFKPESEAVTMNAIWPRPSYLLLSMDDDDKLNGQPVSGGLLMSARPSIQVPILKHSFIYENIKRTGEFVISIPLRSHITSFEKLEKYSPTGFEAAGLTVLQPNSPMQTPGIKEYPVNIDCKTFALEEIPETNYALLIGKKIGMTVDEELLNIPTMQLYAQYLYAVLDRGLARKWGFQDVNNLSVRPLPSWGSRYHGGWWTGPEQYQAGMHFWLVELVQAGYLSEEEFFKIRRWLSWWRREGFPAPEPLQSELKTRLTTLLKMMVWAHRDYDKWHEIHAFLAKFPYEGPWKSP